MPTTAQWSLFSANSNSLHKCLGIRHPIQYTKSLLSFEKGSPKVYKALKTNKLNWFSASNVSLSKCLFDEKQHKDGLSPTVSI